MMPLFYFFHRFEKSPQGKKEHEYEYNHFNSPYIGIAFIDIGGSISFYLEKEMYQMPGNNYHGDVIKGI